VACESGLGWRREPQLDKNFSGFSLDATLNGKKANVGQRFKKSDFSQEEVMNAASTSLASSIIRVLFSYLIHVSLHNASQVGGEACLFRGLAERSTVAAQILNSLGVRRYTEARCESFSSLWPFA
jgi:hypothetical protein